MKYKAILCDVDGTLIPNKRGAVVSERTKQVVAAASKKIHIGLATTRPMFMLQDISSVLNLSGLSVISGGAEIINLSSGEVLSQHLISDEDFQQLVETFVRMNIPLHLDNGKIEMTYEVGASYTDVMKVFTFGIEEERAEMLMGEFDHSSTLAKFKVPSHQKGAFDVFFTNAKATKQYGILEVARLLNISTEEMIGIGDGHNDFPLLMACGLKVAMGNAVEDLKAIADYVAPSADDDGVAHVLEKFVLNN